MLSAVYQKTSENVASPGATVKLMIQIDCCPKQREERMGFCMKRGHSSSYCVFYNRLNPNISPIGHALYPECGVSVYTSQETKNCTHFILAYQDDD